MKDEERRSSLEDETPGSQGEVEAGSEGDHQEEGEQRGARQDIGHGSTLSGDHPGPDSVVSRPKTRPP